MNLDKSSTLALDVHGGDHGPKVTVPAAVDALAESPGLRIILVGRPDEIEPLLAGVDAGLRDRLVIEATSEVITSDARPRAILRAGPEFSLYRALQLVHEGRAQSCVSAGNTVALMALGVKLLGVLPGVSRPALMSQFPNAAGTVGMLDLGANLNVDARQLAQFAFMGAEVRRAAHPERPASVGLLNVGHEDGKGHAVVREAHELLKASDLDYRGFIEGHDIFEGTVDLAVCDGFAGNLVLKSSEGLAAMLFGEFRKTLESTWRSRLGALLAKPALKAMVERLDPAKHNGAPLLGLNGVLVKSHGRSGRLATTQAILEAGQEAQHHVPDRIEAVIKKHERETAS
ncbi:phosphate acyltransferase PlsX [Marinihelvus fidelis]|uniref:Phosphate acyltransferase n=1 Tax=Marinihelvus fidelis TaxID=2613842 RepID=A0A5N0TD74_9GAMM|nr:phosphate acyltransferase PlsX [Marinihelvus fidelis]KAA9132017.1 phosphate acyltransferase PlsX [Marinihelvus fidelis]